MKKNLLLLIALAFFGLFGFGQNTLNIPPTVLGYGSTTLPAGSLIIGMDRVTQGAASVFNMKAYGLAVHLLNNNKRLRWVMKTGKVHNGIDFSASSELLSTTATVSPTTLLKTITNSKDSLWGTVTDATGLTVGMEVTAGGSANEPVGAVITFIIGTKIYVSLPFGAANAAKTINFTTYSLSNFSAATYAAAANRDFAAGPFVIFNADTAGVVALVAFFNAKWGTNVHVYRNVSPINNVEVRYDYLINGVIWKPRVAVLDDGGNADIQLAYFPLGGINASNGFWNYASELTPAFTTRCYTMATEPHNAKDTNLVVQVSPLITTGTIIRDIRGFVQGGGNFLAQCHAIVTYENYYGSGPVAPGNGGRFMSKFGISDPGAGLGAAVTYHNPDFSYGQFDGLYAQTGGSIQTYELNATVGNAWVNNEHPFITGSVLTNVREEGVCKLTAASSLGGMIFYLGSHKYDVSDEENRNGLRFYFNAMMTPTNSQGSLSMSGTIHPGSNFVQTYADFTILSAPSDAYPFTFKLFKESGATPGYQEGEDNDQQGSTVTINFLDPHNGIITGSTLPAFSPNTTFYLTRTPAPGCLQGDVVEITFNTLPIELGKFTAERVGNDVNLNWETISEQNNTGFDVERLVENGSWQKIGFVATKASHLNSNATLNYEFVDVNNLAQGVSQYRLKQIDLDNHSSYSPIRAVLGLDKTFKILVFPNPSNDGKVNVLFEEANVVRNITLLDINGRAIKQWKGVTNNNMQIEHLAPGFYSLRILNTKTNKQSVEKIIINKQ